MPGRVDDKGRLKLPTVFQSFLSERAPLIVVYREGEPLSVYPEETWKQSSSVVVLSDSTGIDGVGRIFLGKDLREKAKLKLSETARLSWHKDHLEIMSEAQYQDLQERAIGAAKKGL